MEAAPTILEKERSGEWFKMIEFPTIDFKLKWAKYFANRLLKDTLKRSKTSYI